MHCVGDELDEGPSETEVEKSQILGDSPGDSQQTESHGSQVQGHDRKDEESEREGDRESQEIEERVVRDA